MDSLIAAQEVLRRQYPGWEFSPVDADFALDRGIPEVGSVEQLEGTKSRPDYFLIGRPTRGGVGLKVVVLECKGTHDSSSGRVIEQLAKACTQVRAVEIGGRNFSSLMVASRFLASGIKISVIDPPGEVDLWSGEEEEFDEILNESTGDPPEFFNVHTPAPDYVVPVTERPESEAEYRNEEFESWESPEGILKTPQVVSMPQASRKWFSRVLARTFAASVLAFAGDGETAAKYHVPRRYQDLGQQGLPLEGAAEMNKSELFSLPGGMRARGMRYSMILPDGRRLDVFRGVEERVYDYLGEQRLGSYFRAAHRLWDKWDEIKQRDLKDGRATSVGRDGTVLSMRIGE